MMSYGDSNAEFAVVWHRPGQPGYEIEAFPVTHDTMIGRIVENDIQPRKLNHRPFIRCM